MPTENRRIAAYLPQHIDEKLETFKSDRGLKGDSQALVLILSEFFGVDHQVAYSTSVTTEQVHEIFKLYFSQIQAQLQDLEDQAVRIEGMENRLLLLEKWRAGNEFKASASEPLDELLNRVSSLESHLDKALIRPPSVGQLSILDGEGSDIPINSPSELPVIDETSALDEKQINEPETSSLPQSLSEDELARRLKRGKSTVRQWKNQGSGILAKKTKEIDKFAWRFDAQVKRYYPISNAEPLSQVNPEAPEGSEQSGEG